MTSIQAFWQVFGDVLIALWVGLTICTALVGVWAVLIPASFIRFNQRLSVWVNLNKSNPEQQKSISIERPFYRYHVITGLVLIIASVYVLYEAVFNLNAEAIKQSMISGSTIQAIWFEILIDAALGWIYISGVVAFIIGTLVVVRPSYLKGIEQRMNYWVETGKYSQTLDKSNQILDEWVSAYPRIFGIISLLGSAIVAWSLYKFGYLA